MNLFLPLLLGCYCYWMDSLLSTASFPTRVFLSLGTGVQSGVWILFSLLKNLVYCKLLCVDLVAWGCRHILFASSLRFELWHFTRFAALFSNHTFSRVDFRSVEHTCTCFFDFFSKQFRSLFFLSITCGGLYKIFLHLFGFGLLLLLCK